MELPKREKPKQTRAFLLILASYGIIVPAMIMIELTEQMALNDFSEIRPNLVSLIIQWAAFWSVAWAIFALPINLITLRLYRRHFWSRFRTLIVLAPSMIFLGLAIRGLAFNYPTPSKEFQVDAGVPLPKSARGLHSSWDRNLWYTTNEDMFYFRCDPSDTEMLIKDMHLKENLSGIPDSPAPEKPNWPDVREWQGMRVFNGVTYEANDDELIHHTLITDKTETQVYFLLGS